MIIITKKTIFALRADSAFYPTLSRGICFKEKDAQRTHSKSNPRDLSPFRHWIRMMRRHTLTNKKTKTTTKTITKTKEMANTTREHPQRAIAETCDI